MSITNSTTKTHRGVRHTSRAARWSLVLGIGAVGVPLVLVIVSKAFGIKSVNPDRWGTALLVGPFLLSVSAIVLGIHAVRSIDHSPDDLGGKPIVAAGLLLSGMQIAGTCVWLVSQTEKPRQAAARITSVNNLKQIAIALHSFHDDYQYFPSDGAAPLSVPSKLSWRVQILPYLEQQRLYDQFHHDEPWDSPHNLKLLPLMPNIYLDPRFQSRQDLATGLTYYRGFAGPGGVLGANPPVSLALGDNVGFAANTLMAIEAGDSVPWTKPEDPDFNESSPFGGPKRVKFVAVFVDGHVQTLPQDFDREMIRRMMNWENTEPINLP